MRGHFWAIVSATADEFKGNAVIITRNGAVDDSQLTVVAAPNSDGVARNGAVDDSHRTEGVGNADAVISGGDVAGNVAAVNGHRTAPVGNTAAIVIRDRAVIDGQCATARYARYGAIAHAPACGSGVAGYGA